jgi:hypothetical protein
MFNDTATNFTHGSAVTIGDNVVCIAICLSCGGLAIYTDNRGRMRAPTAEESAWMRGDKKLWKLIQRHRWAIACTRAERGPPRRGKEAEKN